jgi:hypothetical protein
MSDVESWKFEPVVAFGTPSDNVRETSKQIGSELQAYYDRLLWLPLPQELTERAARILVASERRRGENACGND